MFKYYGKTAPYLFLLPAALVLVVFFFIPFFQTILLSFQDYSTNIYQPNWVALQNYIEILRKGTDTARKVAKENLIKLKTNMGINYFN